MKTAAKDDPVIILLNDVLTAELTAINQYFIHAELCQHWGYQKLYKIMRGQSLDEMKHAEKLLERILYLNGIPNMQRLGKVSVGESVPEQFNLDLRLEQEAVSRLTHGIQQLQAHPDHGSRLLLESILISEEEHIDWIDAQLELIQQTGVENYLAMQIHAV